MGASALRKEKAVEENWTAVPNQQLWKRLPRKSRQVDFVVVGTLLERVRGDLCLLGGVGVDALMHAH